jgi:hypothetical protein
MEAGVVSDFEALPYIGVFEEVHEADVNAKFFDMHDVQLDPAYVDAFPVDAPFVVSALPQLARRFTEPFIHRVQRYAGDSAYRRLY